MVNDTLSEKKQLAAELVCKAIADLNEKKGSTLRTIRQYIGSEYQIPPNVIRKLIIPSLQNGVTFGVITNKTGHYQLSNLMDNIVDLACKRRKKCCPPKCPPKRCCSKKSKRKCRRSSKNFRRIDYKSADVSYEDRDNPCCTTPKPCEPCVD